MFATFTGIALLSPSIEHALGIPQKEEQESGRIMSLTFFSLPVFGVVNFLLLAFAWDPIRQMLKLLGVEIPID